MSGEGGSEAGVTRTAGAGAEADPLHAALRAGAPLLGRFTLLRALGRGGMGVVYSAYDNELDRKVAIKLLHRGERKGSVGDARILREAQAMARLSHPNVVQVYDVGLLEGQVFLAMEYVHGDTLRAWQEAAPRPWREVLRLYRQAGEGLAAAHGAGLVHRDFKPDNAILGDDGRVRVVDFGLAAWNHGEAEEADAGAGAGAGEVLRSASGRWSTTASGRRPLVTALGTLIGTPAYMSPEQHMRLAVDARSDVFSFCVALHEGLYGARPFAGATAHAIREAVFAGAIAPPPAGRSVPGWLRRAIVRGLAFNADERPPTMQALLAALDRDPARARRRWLVGLGLAAAAAGGGALVVQARSEAAATCGGGEARLAGVWDRERAAAVEAALRGTGLTYAEDVWERVRVRLDAYTEAWVAMRGEACEATVIRREQSAELLDRRMECLGERLEATRALVDVLAQADAGVASRAIQAVAELPTLDACADTSALLGGVPSPTPAQRPAVAAVREQIALLHADTAAGRFEGSEARGAAVLAAADASTYAPVIVEAKLHAARAAEARGDDPRAAELYAAAYHGADAVGDDRARAAAAVELVLVAGVRLARPAEGELWARQAEAVLQRLGAGQDALWAVLHRHRGGLRISQGDLDGAEPHLLEALAIEERLGADRPTIAECLKQVGNLEYRRGRYGEAQRRYQEALTRAEEVLGRDHPEVAWITANLGESLRIQGDLAGAHERFARSLAIGEAAVGGGSPRLAPALNGLGAVAQERGEHEDAIARYRRLVALVEASSGPRHPIVASGLSNLCGVLVLEGRAAEARGHCERARAILEELYGPDHPGLGDVLTDLAEVALLLGADDEALAQLARATAIWEGAFGPEHPDLSKPLRARGELELRRGRPGDAIAPLERALALRELDAGAHELAGLRLALARALWDAGRERARARALAQDARAGLAGAIEPAARKALGEVEAWLAAHP